MAPPKVSAVGAIVRRDDELLLVRRGRPPGVGLWSVPGGHVEAGESDAQAVVREVAEETGLAVTPGRLLGEVERPGLAGTVFAIRDYEATVVGGELNLGDDAAEVRWVRIRDLPSYDLVVDLLDTLTVWGVVSPPDPAPRDRR